MSATAHRHCRLGSLTVVAGVLVSAVAAGDGMGHGMGERSDCCIVHETPGCDDPTCDALICSLDPSCCTTEWDAVCAFIANRFCTICGGGCPRSDHDCYTSGGPGCTDLACCMTVCQFDPFCCETQWDGVCVDATLAFCTVTCVGTFTAMASSTAATSVNYSTPGARASAATPASTATARSTAPISVRC